MKYFVLTNTEAGWDCVRGIYQAVDEQPVRDFIEEKWLDSTNDPVKAEKDRLEFWDKYILHEKDLTIIDSKPPKPQLCL